MGRRAIEAYAAYGKGQGSKARLNLGDVFAYASAKCYGVPSLYKGKDFIHTDLG
jgi:ribonuclease VapC